MKQVFRPPHGPVSHYYPPPNGGQRMLPSLYGRLRRTWVSSRGSEYRPKDMERSHLENTIALLKESNRNVVARATDLLGRMSHHFQNQPEIRMRLAALCILMQKVEVNEMYPVFDALAEELSYRQRHVVENEDLDNWCDIPFYP